MPTNEYDVVVKVKTDEKEISDIAKQIQYSFGEKQWVNTKTNQTGKTAGVSSSVLTGLKRAFSDGYVTDGEYISVTELLKMLQENKPSKQGTNKNAKNIILNLFSKMKYDTSSIGLKVEETIDDETFEQFTKVFKTEAEDMRSWFMNSLMKQAKKDLNDKMNQAIADMVTTYRKNAWGAQASKREEVRWDREILSEPGDMASDPSALIAARRQRQSDYDRRYAGYNNQKEDTEYELSLLERFEREDRKGTSKSLNQIAQEARSKQKVIPEKAPDFKDDQIQNHLKNIFRFIKEGEVLMGVDGLYDAADTNVKMILDAMSLLSEYMEKEVGGGISFENKEELEKELQNLPGFLEKIQQGLISFVENYRGELPQNVVKQITARVFEIGQVLGSADVQPLSGDMATVVREQLLSHIPEGGANQHQPNAIRATLSKQGIQVSGAYPTWAVPQVLQGAIPFFPQQAEDNYVDEIDFLENFRKLMERVDTQQMVAQATGSEEDAQKLQNLLNWAGKFVSGLSGVDKYEAVKEMEQKGYRQISDGSIKAIQDFTTADYRGLIDKQRSLLAEGGLTKEEIVSITSFLQGLLNDFSKSKQWENDNQEVEKTAQAMALREVLSEFPNRKKWTADDFTDLGLVAEGINIKNFKGVQKSKKGGGYAVSRESIEKKIEELTSFENGVNINETGITEALQEAEDSYIKETLRPYLESYLDATSSAQKGAITKAVKKELGEDVASTFQAKRDVWKEDILKERKNGERDALLSEHQDFYDSLTENPVEMPNGVPLFPFEIDANNDTARHTQLAKQAGALKEEGTELFELNDQYEEHEGIVQGAIQAEAGKILVSEKLAKALSNEEKALGEATKAAEEHQEKISVEGFIPEFDAATHHYTKSGDDREVLTATQLRDLLLRGENPTFGADLARVKAEAESKFKAGKGPLTAEDMNMSQNDFDFMTENVIGSGLRGDLFHDLIDKMVNADAHSLEELKEKDEKAFEDYQKQYHETVQGLAKYGIGEEFLQIERRLAGYMDAQKKSGLTATQFSEQRLGMEMKGPRGNFLVGVTPDQLYSYGEGGKFGAFMDTKTGSVKGYEAFQLTLQKIATEANWDSFKDQLGNIDFSQVFKGFIANVEDGKTEFIEYLLLSLEEAYNLVADAVDIHNGIRGPLSKEEQKARMNRQRKTGKITGYADGEPSNTSYEMSGGLRESPSTEQKLIKESLDYLQKKLNIEKELFQAEGKLKTLQETGGSETEISNAKKQVDLLQRRLDLQEELMDSKLPQEFAQTYQIGEEEFSQTKYRIGDTILSDAGAESYFRQAGEKALVTLGKEAGSESRDSSRYLSFQQNYFKNEIDQIQKLLAYENDLYDLQTKQITSQGKKDYTASIEYRAEELKQLTGIEDAEERRIALVQKRKEIEDAIANSTLLSESQKNQYYSKLDGIFRNADVKRLDIASSVPLDNKGDSVSSRDISRYLGSLRQGGVIERDIARLQNEGRGLSGTKATENLMQINALNQRLAAIKQIQDAYNAQEGTLNGVRLKEDQIKQIEDGRAQIIENNRLAMEKMNVSVSNQVGLVSKLKQSWGRAWEQLGDFVVSYLSFDRVRQSIQQLNQAAIQLDATMVDLQIASGSSRTIIKGMMQDFANLGYEIGRSTREIATAANDWLRAGYTGQQATELTRASMNLSTLGMISSADATSYLISMLKGWKMEVEDIGKAVDKLTALDMAFAVDAGSIASGASRANASARLANSDMDRFLAMLTVAGDVTQRDMGSVGNGLRTVYSRYANVAAGKFVATQKDIESENYNEEEWSGLNDVEKSLGALGIKIRSSVDKFRNFDDVMDEIAGNWNTYSDVQKSAIATSLAGKHMPEHIEIYGLFIGRMYSNR